MKKKWLAGFMAIAMGIVFCAGCGAGDRGGSKPEDTVPDTGNGGGSEIEDTTPDTVKGVEVPYTVAAIATSSDMKTGTSIISSSEQLQNYLDELDAYNAYKSYKGWSMKTKDGTVIDRDYLNGYSTKLESTALIVSVFYGTSCPVTVTKHSLRKDNGTVFLDIEFYTGWDTALEYAMVILEVSPQDVADAKEIRLTATDLSLIGLLGEEAQLFSNKN